MAQATDIHHDIGRVGDDLIIGMAAIAAELGVSKRKASYWHESGALPTFKVRGTVCARRSQLYAELRAKERATPDPEPEPAAQEPEPAAPDPARRIRRRRVAVER